MPQKVNRVILIHRAILSVVRVSIHGIIFSKENVPQEVNGIVFDSKKEARRYLDLRAMEIAGQIQNLRLQVPYLLIPSQRIDGKVVEREVKYVADFTYEQNGETVVEDSKGHRTKDYIIKRKLMLSVWGIRIKEV